MGPGPGGFRNSREKMIEKLKEPKPEKFSEIPGYLRRVKNTWPTCGTTTVRPTAAAT